MRSTSLPACALLPLLMLGQASSCHSTNSNTMSTNATNQDRKAISGSWGGADIALEVTTEGVEINFDCATGHIDKAIVPDSAGKFSVSGTYIREHGGPMRNDETQDRKGATYKGTVNGEKMSLSVT